MPVKHGLVCMLHEQGRPGRVPMQGDVIRTEGMPEDVAVLGQAGLPKGRLLLPIVNWAANLPVVIHLICGFDQCRDGLVPSKGSGRYSPGLSPRRPIFRVLVTGGKGAFRMRKRPAR